MIIDWNNKGVSMKYKNIELIAGDDSMAELLVHVLIPKDADDDILEFVDCYMCVDLPLYLHESGLDVDVSRETEYLVSVRLNGGISFDRDGVKLLIDQMYKKTAAYVEEYANNLEVHIGVHVDGPGEAFVFYDKNGNWYNEDSVMPEEFLENLEY